MTMHLMIHGLGTPPPHISAYEASYWLSVDAFKGILDLSGQYAAELSFDDANSTDIEIALPLLKAAGKSGTFFLPTDRLGHPGYLSTNDVRLLRAAGMEIGSHGCAHIEWTKASDDEVANDVSHSIARLNAILNEPVQDVAVPFGACDLRVMRILRKLGIGRVYTSFRGRIRENAWIIPRTCMTSDLSLADIERTLARKYTVADDTLDFLRTWKHVGHAALWSQLSATRTRGARPLPPLPTHHAPGAKSPAYR